MRGFIEVKPAETVDSHPILLNVNTIKMVRSRTLGSKIILAFDGDEDVPLIVLDSYDEVMNKIVTANQS